MPHVSFSEQLAQISDLYPVCLVPGVDGVIFPREWKKALWDRYAVALSEAFGINPKTVTKWRKRQAVGDQKTAWEFLEDLLSVIPYRIHNILTDNGIQFAE